MVMPASLNVRQAAQHILSAGLLAYPTEAVWGLGCNPFDKEAFERLLALKGRDPNKGVILLFHSLEQLKPYAKSAEEIKRIEQYEMHNKRATTYLLDVVDDMPMWLKGKHSSLAVRICQHLQVQELLYEINMPLVSSSLNPQGKQPARQQFQVQRYFADEIKQSTLKLSQGSIGADQKPSRIINLADNAVIRR